MAKVLCVSEMGGDARNKQMSLLPSLLKILLKGNEAVKLNVKRDKLLQGREQTNQEKVQVLTGRGSYSRRGVLGTWPRCSPALLVRLCQMRLGEL